MIKQSRMVLTRRRDVLFVSKMQKISALAAYLGCAAMLKLFYSHATPGDLQWILQPAALVVEMFTGIHFVYNALEGYCSIDHEIIIAPACAGVNFMIIIVCLTASLICKFRQIRKIGEFCAYLVAILAIAYSATLFFNTLRIIIAIECYGAGIQWGYLTPERIHRLVGIVIYFAGAWVVYLLAGIYLNQAEGFFKFKKEKNVMYLIPLIWYVTIMVIIPLMQGKQNHGSQLFFEHILFTISIPLLITFLFVSSKKFAKHWRIHS